MRGGGKGSLTILPKLGSTTNENVKYSPKISPYWHKFCDEITEYCNSVILTLIQHHSLTCAIFAVVRKLAISLFCLLVGW